MIRKEKETKRVSYGEVATGLNQGLEAADPMRLDGLTQLKRVREVKGANFQREQARLTQKLGADHPRVLALGQKLEANVRVTRDIDHGISRAQTPTVQPDPNAWTLHGHVRNEMRRGLPNMTIGLYDDKGKFIEEGGYACTDANGYFRLTVKSDRSAGSIKGGTDVKGAQEAAAGTKRAAETAATGAKAAPDAAANAAQPADPKAAAYTTTAFMRSASINNAPRPGIFIHVTDSQGATRFVDSESLDPKLGEVVYREIILDGDGCECVPPDGKPRPGNDTEGRYLGNRKSFELHDLNNTKPGCQLDEIKASQRESFTSQKAAVAAGYDFCAHCFPKGKSKR